MDVQPKLKSNPADAMNQNARRRRKSLSKKASEYSSECDADIHLVLRMKKSGKIFVLASNTKDWSLSQHQLVSLLGHRCRRQKGTNLLPKGLINPHPFKCLQATRVQAVNLYHASNKCLPQLDALVGASRLVQSTTCNLYPSNDILLLSLCVRD
jgi:hypothetical protein